MGEAVFTELDAKSASEWGFDSNNKNIKINRIIGFEIDKFRTFNNQAFSLGEYMTVFSGRNGSMKTSLLGLIAHIFDSSAKDAFGKELKTTLKEVFKLSDKYDTEKYTYHVLFESDGKIVKEPVNIYYVAENTNRHRVVVSGSEKGDGTFYYNTSFLNLKRLYPLVATRANEDSSFELTEDEAKQLKSFYERVFPSTAYSDFTPVHHKNLKTTFGPQGDDAKYDWRSISSGEDNLGSIFNRLIGFQRDFKKGQKHGNGVLCIDEFECSLHPVAQIKLFDYLYDWAQKYKVQIIITTHSLHILQYIYLNHEKNMGAKRIVVNFVSKAGSSEGNHPIVNNPPYERAYKELTFKTPEQLIEQRKIKIFCEDDIAIHFAKRLIKNQTLTKLLDFHSSVNDEDKKNKGTSWTALKTLCGFPLLLENSIVLFDADVESSVTSKIKNKNFFLSLPDEDGLALERRIICFIIDLKNDDIFFSKFDKEKEMFLGEISSFDIPLKSSEVKNKDKVKIEKCKNWATSQKGDFNKYVTYYVSCIEDQASLFRDELIKKINIINVQLGLPVVSNGKSK